MNKLKIGVYYREHAILGTPVQEYHFGVFSGTPPEVAGHAIWGNLVRAVPLPEEFAGEMAGMLGNRTLMRLGIIGVRRAGGTLWQTVNYQPKQELPEKTARGLGYFLEAEALTHLKQLGATHVSTGDKPNNARTGQVLKAGLQPRVAYGIDEWIGALRRGMRMPHRT